MKRLAILAVSVLLTIGALGACGGGGGSDNKGSRAAGWSAASQRQFTRTYAALGEDRVRCFLRVAQQRFPSLTALIRADGTPAFGAFQDEADVRCPV